MVASRSHAQPVPVPASSHEIDDEDVPVARNLVIRQGMLARRAGRTESECPYGERLAPSSRNSWLFGYRFEERREVALRRRRWEQRQDQLNQAADEDALARADDHLYAH